VELIANWVWQGCLVALTGTVLLRALKRSLAQVRYVVCWAALSAVLVLPLQSFVWVGASPPAGLESRASDSAPLVSVPNAWWTSSAMVIAAWSLWSAVQLVQLGVATLALRRTRKRCRAFPSTREARLRLWTRLNQRGRPADLVVSEDVRAAAVLGGRSPRIALAPVLLDRLSDDELESVVIHEWAHVQRRDDFAHAVQLAVRVIAGWHPAVWWLDRRLRVERETACDETAVTVVGSARSYAGCLVKLAGLPVGSGVKTLPALGAMSSTPALASRIERILSHTRMASPTWSRSVATVVMVLLAAVSIATGSMRLVSMRLGASAAMASTPGADREPRPTPMQPAATETTRAVVQPSAARKSAVASVPSQASGRHLVSERNVSHPEERVSSPPPEVGLTRFDLVFESIETAALHGAAVPDAAVPPLAAPPGDKQPDSPWAAAADAGVAIGRGSKKAGLATAGLFTRIGKGIASSF
jgi:beta-lactamase regulating signal transducer with metallopeptidase domain